MPVIRSVPDAPYGPYGTAMLVLSLGFLICNFLWRATLLASVERRPAGRTSAQRRAAVLFIAIGVVMALDQLGLATSVILTAFAIAFDALMLGLAIAFGLGVQAAAKILLEEQFRAKKKRDTVVGSWELGVGS